MPGVVLNACRSATHEEDAEDPFASVAAALLRAGTRSVVAMSYSLYVSGAQQFLPAFYRRLFERGSFAELALALALARPLALSSAAHRAQAPQDAGPRCHASAQRPRGVCAGAAPRQRRERSATVRERTPDDPQSASLDIAWKRSAC